MIADYLVVHSLQEALSILAASPEQPRIVAGGTDGLARLREAEQPILAVDISRADDLSGVRRGERFIEIGAAVTLARADQTPWLADEAPALSEALARVGSPQIRSQGTVVGNILTGRAAANVRVAAAALGAMLKIAGPDGERRLAADGQGNGSLRLARGEIAVSLLIPRGPAARASAYQCHLPRRGFAYAAASVAASVAVSAGEFAGVSLVASPILPLSAKLDLEPCQSCGGVCRICRIIHLSELQEALRGRPATAAAIGAAVDRFDWQGLPMRDSLYSGPAEHRRQMLKVLCRKALLAALSRQD